MARGLSNDGVGRILLDAARTAHDFTTWQGAVFEAMEEVWGPALIRKEIDAGVSGPGYGTHPTYVAMAHLYFQSIETFQAALGPRHKQPAKEAPHFTDIEPIIQVSQVVLG